MEKRIIILLLASLCFCPMPRRAIASNPNAQTTATLPEVVVGGTTGSLLSPGFESAADRLSTVPGAVSIVPPDDFRLGRGSYLEDFLPYAAGVYIESEQGSEDTKVSIRGSGIQSDDIVGLEILLDGMNINQGDGEAFLQDIDLRSVKYAEIYRGADALRWGGATLGGAINLVTMTGRDAPPLEAWFTGGSYGFLEEGMLTGWSKGRTDIFFSVSNHTLDGFRDHSSENDEKFFLSLGSRISDSAENRLYFFYGRLNQDNPSSLTKEEMYANPQQTDAESVAQDWDTDWEYGRVVDRFVVKGDDWQLQMGGYYDHRDQLQRQEFDDEAPLGVLRFHSDDFGADDAYETTAELFGQRNRLTLGINPTFESEVDTDYQNLNGSAGSIISADRTFATNAVLYAENQHYLTKKLSILAGAQLSYVERHYSDRLDPPADGDQSNTEDYWALNPKLGLLYEWNDRSQTYLNVSRSFQPPSFDESLSTAPDGDELFNRLRAQNAITLEAGTRGKAGPFSWDLAVYRSWVRDELLDLTNGNGNPLGTVNADRTVHQGIEAELETELGRGLLSQGQRNEDRLVVEQSFTMNDFRFDNDSVYNNNRIAGAPVDFYKAELRYEHPSGFYCGPNVEWNIVKYPVDEANTLYADPYALLGFRAGYKSNKGFDVFLEVKNLTGKAYAATVEPVGDARVEGYDDFNPGNGRAYYAGISWKW